MATATRPESAKAARKPATRASAKPAVKPAAKPVEKPAAQPVTKAAPQAAAKATPAVKAAKPAKVAKAPKADKPKKPKLVRDSFTIPKAEYEVIDALKQRVAKAGSPAKKSELLRAGIKALAAMNDAALLAAVKAVPSIKTGRPAKA